MAHGGDCWHFHHDCAVAEIYRLKKILDEIEQIDAAAEATGSRDFGRGFSLALSLVRKIINGEDK